MDYQANFIEGSLKQSGIIENLALDNLFFIIHIKEGFTIEGGKKLINDIKTDLNNLVINHLDDLEVFCSNVIKRHNLPSDFSLAAGYLKGEILYLKTVGQGAISIAREGKNATLISGNQAASGFVKENDKLTFSLGDSLDLSRLEVDFCKKREVSESPEMIVAEYETVVSPPSMPQKKRTITFAIVLILLVVFLWSVILGYQRRTGEAESKSVNSAKELIAQKLATAVSTAPLNIDRAIADLSASKSQYESLKKSYPKNSQLKEIKTLIDDAESKILKKESKNFSEFFDLTLDDKNAKADKLFLESDKLLMLDKTQGVLYTLSLGTKSLTKHKLNEIKKADLIASSSDADYFYVTGMGVYQVDSNDHVKKVVENDSQWGTIKAMWIYNGNIYLLDTGKDEIYKYLATDNGFSGKVSYFASGQSVDLSWVTSMAIDSSLYLAGGSSVIKFTSGLRDGFKMNLPNSQVSFTKIFTTRDLDNFYAWDKGNSTIYVMNKDGTFKSQLNSTILGKASDIVVYQDKVYAVYLNKVFKID